MGADCVIGQGTRLVDTALGNGVTVQSSLLIRSTAGDGCRNRSLPYLRPGTVLAEGVKVGDFVELKQVQVGRDNPHLSYVGDTVLGAGVNVGAGTITCNYDGVSKHRTANRRWGFYRQQHQPGGSGQHRLRGGHRSWFHDYQGRSGRVPGGGAEPADGGPGLEGQKEVRGSRPEFGRN